MATGTLPFRMDRLSGSAVGEDIETARLGQRAGALGIMLQLLRVAQALVAAVLFAAIAVVLAGIAPTLVGFESFTVYSGSMEPAIHVGSLAVVQAAPSRDLRPGDVITYRTPSQPDVVVTHRLVSVVETGDGKRQFRTKGDANQVEDIVQVDPGGVLGKVVYSVPYAGYVVEFSKQPQGRALLVVLPVLVLGVDFLRGRIRTRALAAREDADAAAATSAGVSEADRVARLIERGYQALERGHPVLAERAAEGVLAHDPRNEDGWLLKSRAIADPGERIQLLHAAVLLNPGARRLATELASLKTGMSLGGQADPASVNGRDADRR